MADILLFEIGTEEIPARFLPKINLQLQELTENKLKNLNIPYEKITIYSTPRRMAIMATGLPARQPDSMVEAKGPSLKIAKDATGEFSKAAQGFAKSQNIELAELVERDGYIYAIKQIHGQAVVDLLPIILKEIINSINFPKNMRWGNHETRFVRPIHWLLALLNDTVIPVEITDIHSDRFTYGHRFLSNGKLTIAHANEYVEVLRNHFVIVDQTERKTNIVEQIKAVAIANKAEVHIDEELLEEVVYLVEYPTALCGSFDEEFLKLPKEAVITPMKEHQRYFPLFNEQAKLMPKFITVRNGDDKNLAEIAHGNERVLRARLSDANFFFSEDRKKPLEQRVEKLKTVVFQDGLGSMYDKVQRISSLAVEFAKLAGYSELELVAKTAYLAKADLVTGMVYEFTELQGIMGREYAKLEKQHELVYEGIFEHYLPRFAGDVLPQTPTGLFVGLADKIDNIVATFSRGLIPTGSQDPYALRRQALGIVNILATSSYTLSLDQIVAAACRALAIEGDKRIELTNKLQDFFTLRIKNMLTEQGLKYDLVDAILAMRLMDVQDIAKRALAIKQFAQTENFAPTVQAFVRISNLSKDVSVASLVDESLLNEESEKSLYEAFAKQKDLIATNMNSADYFKALELIADLVPAINGFFEKVMVMDKNESIKNNRLAMLVNIRECVLQIVDFTKIVLG